MGKWHYPKWKRVAMQAVLFIVFATSLSLAQWVVHDRQVNGITRLDAVEFFGPIGIRRPEGWSLRSPSINATVRVTLDEPANSEASDDRSGRQLDVTAEHVTPGISVETYLGQGRIASIDQEPMNIGPVKGIFIGRRTFEDVQMHVMSGLAVDQYRLIACGIDPNGLAITIVLKCPYPSDADAETQKEYRQENKILIRDVARGIVVQSDEGKR